VLTVNFSRSNPGKLGQLTDLNKIGAHGDELLVGDENLPLSHAVQFEIQSPANPGLQMQSVRLEEPARDSACCGQAMHDVVPVELLYVLAGHHAQLLAPAWLEYEPARHFLQSEGNVVLLPHTQHASRAVMRI